MNESNVVIIIVTIHVPVVMGRCRIHASSTVAYVTHFFILRANEALITVDYF